MLRPRESPNGGDLDSPFTDLGSLWFNKTDDSTDVAKLKEIRVGDRGEEVWGPAGQELWFEPRYGVPVIEWEAPVSGKVSLDIAFTPKHLPNSGVTLGRVRWERNGSRMSRALGRISFPSPS